MIEKEKEKGREWGVSSPICGSREAGPDGGRVTQSQRWKRAKLLSSPTLKEISQMREGVHANVKAMAITSFLVLQGEG